MTDTTNRDALDAEIAAVLQENRIVLARTEHTGERMLTAWYAYTEAMDNLLRKVGIELPEPGARASRRRRL